jgi:hypothetical protein
MGYIGSGVQRFNTADGLTVTGSAEINSLTYPTADGSNGQVLKTNGSGTLSFGTVSTDLVNDTSPQLGGVLDTNGNNIEFPDSSGAEVNRLKFGAGDDLQIYHDGSDSYINDTGTGNLRLAGSSQVDIISSGGEFMAKFIADGAATLYHNNAAKISTTATGIDVQGQVIATKGSTGTLATFTDGVATNFTMKTDGSSVGTFGTEAGSTQLAFMVANTEAARFDGSRNLLIGKTADNVATVGIEARATGPLISTRDGSDALRLNRLNSDGEIIQLRKDGTTIGSIGVVNNNNPFIANDADNSGLQFASTSIIAHYDGTQQNNAVDLGSTSVRWKDGYFNNGITARYHYNLDDPDTYFDFATGNNIKVFNGGSEKFRFGSDGAFSVGVTSTSAPGAGNTATGCTLRGAIGDAFFSRSNGTAGYFNVNQNDNVLTVLRSGVGVGGINVTTSGATFATTSDIRLKQDIEPLVATDKLMQMNPVSYSWKADPDGPRSMGFIAQEMEEVMPEAVSIGTDDKAMMSMDYGRITPILVSALQDAHRKIEQLEQRLAEMEAK